MRRFEQDGLLSRLVAAGKLLPRHIDALARQVSEFHARIPVADPSSRFGTPEAVAEPILANFMHLDRDEGAGDTRIIKRLQSWCETELLARRDVLLERKRLGCVRECHGDMHLGNMILADDAITIFDCIEFNEDLRWIDVISEIAFCTMDLEDRGRTDLARRFLNGSLEWSGDYAALAVFPLYFTYRALVRAKVAQLRRAQHDLPSDEDDALKQELHNYLAHAERSTRRGDPCPFLAITRGLSGSGKTWGSQAAVEGLGAIRVRSDLERKRLAGFHALANTSSGIATGLYSPEFNRRTFQKLASLATEILAAGFPAIVDATFLKRSDRDPFRVLAETLRVPFLILDFAADEATCRERIRRRTKERADASEATEAVLDHQLQSREPLADEEGPFAVSFDTQQPATIERTLVEIQRRLARISQAADL
jgi:predicted kinase